METSETSHDYHGVIAPLDNSHRLIICPQGIQWIVQKWKGNRWRSVSFYRRREPLLDHLRSSLPSLTGKAEDVVAMLPAILN